MTPHTTIHPAAANQPATYVATGPRSLNGSGDWHDGAAVAVPVMLDLAFAGARLALLETQIEAERDYGERLDAIIARVERVLS